MKINIKEKRSKEGIMVAEGEYRVGIALPFPIESPEGSKMVNDMVVNAIKEKILADAIEELERHKIGDIDDIPVLTISRIEGKRLILISEDRMEEILRLREFKIITKRKE